MTGSLRFARHQVDLWRRSWYGSAFSTFVAPVLYLASIGLGLGSLIADGGASEALGGVTYAAFAGTGLMAGAAMQTGAGEMAWPVLGSIKYTRTWLAAVATPLRPVDLLGGKALLLLAKLTVSSGVFAVVLAALGLVDPRGAAAAVVPAVLTGMAVGMSLFAVTVTAQKDFTLSSVFRFGVVPMFILSGTFLPVSELPDLARPLAVASPLYHGVELLRAAALDIAPAWPWPAHVAFLAAWTAVSAVVGERMLRRRLHP
ncbi:ABC transporter permease [Euzebya sp.]|uniref:ABC transporter permease n=1 Tax=Euzebya sp. TaxID=1971409 RepID=UPI003518FF1E